MQTIRILHILHSMNRGGAENAIMNYYRHFDREKIQFDFLLTEPKKCLFEDEIEALGGRVFRVPPLSISNPFPYIRGVKNFFKEHPEYKIVHSHTSSKSVIPLGIARICGIPVRCSHSHNSKSEDGFRGFIRNLLIPFLKLTATDYLACGNKAAIWLYGNRAFEEGKVIVFKNVIEADRFRYNIDIREKYRKVLKIDKDVVLLGHTARFCEEKNHLFDIDILKSLKNEGINAKLLLLGNGELKDSIKEKAERYGLADDVFFAGVVPNVFDYEQAMDVFLLPSFREGLPLSIIEAQISGLPCFASAGNVSDESSVTDLVTYISLDDGPDVWAKGIRDAISKPRKDRYEDIVKAGYDASESAIVLQKFYLSKIEKFV